jgi:hypothetical protein
MITAGVDNFLQLESVLIDRLKTVLEPITPRVKVYSASDLEGVKEASLPSPSISLTYHGYRIEDSTRRDGLSITVQQTWMVWVHVRNVATMQSGEKARNQAGEIASHVLKAMMGFKPNEVSKPIVLTNSMPAQYSGGMLYLPLAFTSEIVINNKDKP